MPTPSRPTDFGPSGSSFAASAPSASVPAASSARPRIRHVAGAGSALAGALLPLVAGALLARMAAGDPMTSVNALATRTAVGVPVPPVQWRGCGRAVLRRGREGGAGRAVSGAARLVRGARAGRG
ncbi:hypothetical protein [Streptomyces sp. NBC_00102]|uniref:hypothetical protein n=1 Tax=Streptomyces sp. NBC_00102 TaxID=2975652 RepID=UPI00225AE0CE|nr:hypothetical protein [Streptomyces sp. NBC_00102]MCX5401515.1 hypothetical protein [Streptomyces sp. NBC_00102]